MARITVEDCIDKVDGPYDLVLIAKERTVQLNSGDKPNVDPEKDKNTVIALKEIAENKVSVDDIKETAINKLRKHIEKESGVLDQAEPEGDDFENIYKGEVSKSGVSILPSKRARKIPEKLDIFKKKEEKIGNEINKTEDLSSEQGDQVSLEELKDQEKKEEEKIEKKETSTSSDNI